MLGLKKKKKVSSKLFIYKIFFYKLASVIILGLSWTGDLKSDTVTEGLLFSDRTVVSKSAKVSNIVFYRIFWGKVKETLH